MARTVQSKKTVLATTRISEEMNQRIAQRVATDEFKDRSSFIYKAVYEYLEELDARDAGDHHRFNLRQHQ